MADEGHDMDQDLKALNLVYDELSKDARTIADDLQWGVLACGLLASNLLVLGFIIDSIAISGYIWVMDYISWAGFLAFNLIVPVGGCLFLYKFVKLNARYKTLFRLENHIRMKEYARKKRDRD